MTIRRTMMWVFWLCLSASAAGGSYVWRMWAQSDQMLYERVSQALEESLPGWDVGLARARFDLQGQIRLYQLKLGPKGALPWALLPETVISVDREQLVQQRLVFHQIRLLQPQLELIQNADGTWNWSGLPLPAKTSSYPVECKVERGTIHVRRRIGPEGKFETVTLNNVTLLLTPEGQQRYLVQGHVSLDPIGVIQLDGVWRQDEKSWLVNGRAEKLRWDDALCERVHSLLPELREHLAATSRKLGLPVPETGPPILGLQVAADLFFQLRKPAADEPLGYKWLVRLQQGNWEHEFLPFPLTRLQGKIYGDDKQVLIPRLSAASEQISLLVENLRWQKADPEKTFATQLTLSDVPFDDRTRSYLPPHMLELYDQFGARGTFHLKTSLNYAASTGWKFTNDLSTPGCSIAYEKFPYPVDHVTGTIKQRGQVYQLDLQGRGGGRPVTLVGQVRTGTQNPGVVVDLDVKGLPLDERLCHACPEATRPAVESLRLQGVTDVHYRVTRRGGPTAPWEHHLFGAVREGRMKCTAFPLDIEHLSGILDWDGKRWKFDKLQGVHGDATLTAQGEYAAAGASGLLSLTVETERAGFTDALKSALPPEVQQVWNEVSPQGEFGCVAQIHWMPKQTPDIVMQGQLLNAGIMLKSFPFAFQDVTGRFGFEQKKVTFEEIRGRHDETRLSIPLGWALWDETGWRVRMDQFTLEDLIPDNKFRRALPATFREVIDNLDPRGGLVNLIGMLEFRGTGQTADPVTAAWDLELLCTGLTTTTGIDLERMYGKLFSKGTWDGAAILSEGRAKLDSLTILGYQFSQVTGPVQVKGTQLTIGSNEIVNAVVGNLAAPKVPVEQRFSGKAINGLFTLDGIAVLGQETSYRVFVSMNDARLERYAELYLPQQYNLRGVMNGWAELSGRGNTARQLQGRGQVRIRPAALYELPVLLAVFKVLKGFSPDKTAFDEAVADFTVQNLRMDLNRVDLMGNALTLRGRGWVRFDRRLNLDFYSTSARNRGGIPILSQVWGQATEGLFGVEVRGSLDRPVAEFRPAPKIDDTLKMFLGILEPRPGMAPAAAPPFGRTVPRNSRAN